MPRTPPTWSPHPGFARAFAKAVPEMDRRGAGRHRRELLAPATGTVVEVGSGAGSSFPHYPPAVTRVVAVEPDPYLRGLSEQAAGRAPVPVQVRSGLAEDLPVADGAADVVVASLVLCSATDQEQALREFRRVLRPGGALLFYEHVRSEHPLLAGVEDLVTPLWRRMAGNCHPNRDTLAVIRDGGFRVVGVRRFGFAPASLGPPLAHILGAAVVGGDETPS
ncbi:class I SAM-dependent methyltransferase [Naasia sp. SYSU D00948]|uniref:class I SAM-dependent methyltransferase n=1 Tax=Naasia sp. SYSU D00948 TaxID=2817379 RepID=UPI001B3035EE|nr:class I SAM-dependent methyltransferase [Naasia sp. SYSU D00948]